MSHQIDEILLGTVINVKPYAAFLSFEDGSQGLLHISEISDAFIRDIEKFVEVGDQINVKVLSVDEKNGFLRVSFKRVPPDKAYSTHANGKNHLKEINEEDFQKLKEKLPQWIEETLKKAKENNDD